MEKKVDIKMLLPQYKNTSALTYPANENIVNIKIKTIQEKHEYSMSIWACAAPCCWKCGTSWEILI